MEGEPCRPQALRACSDGRERLARVAARARDNLREIRLAARPATGPRFAATSTSEVVLSLNTLSPDMSPEELLGEVVAAEEATHALLDRAARLARDPEEKALFERLARREEEALRELARMEELLDAEAFVQRAIGC
jgi:hypothetical protein